MAQGPAGHIPPSFDTIPLLAEVLKNREGVVSRSIQNSLVDWFFDKNGNCKYLSDGIGIPELHNAMTKNSIKNRYINKYPNITCIAFLNGNILYKTVTFDDGDIDNGVVTNYEVLEPSLNEIKEKAYYTNAITTAKGSVINLDGTIENESDQIIDAPYVNNIPDFIEYAKKQLSNFSEEYYSVEKFGPYEYDVVVINGFRVAYTKTLIKHRDGLSVVWVAECPNDIPGFNRMC